MKPRSNAGRSPAATAAWRLLPVLAVPALAILSALPVGCERAEPARSAAGELPAGAWLMGDAPSIVRVLDGLAALRGTSAGRAASLARQRIAGAAACREVIAHAERAAGLIDALGCAGADTPVPEALRRLRADASLAFVLPLPDAPSRVRGVARIGAEGGIDAHWSVELPHLSGLARLLVPGERPAGPPRLVGEPSLIHARLRPAGGLDLGGLVESGGQADRLFRLGSSLFTGTALAGTWELAVYPPRDGQAVPPVALGLELALPAAARAGVDAFLADLEATWPIRRSEARFAVPGGGELAGACFFELRILPDFAPCWAIDDDLLVVGWNAASVELAVAHAHAPARPAAGAGPVGAASLDGVVLSLDRWPAAERSLGGEGLDYAWRRVEIAASGAEGRVELALRADGLAP